MGTPKRMIFNEPGLYTLILKSRKPEATSALDDSKKMTIHSMDFQSPGRDGDGGRHVMPFCGVILALEQTFSEMNTPMASEFRGVY